MAANIFGDRFLGSRTPAWHQLGQVFDPDKETVNASEGIRRAGLDYSVTTHPMSIPTPWGDLGQTDRVAIVREPVHDDNVARVFGYAGADYEVIQNRELGAMLDGLSETWPVETVGALGHGETIFLALDAGEFQVGGERVKQFFTIADWKTGNRALQALVTPVRVVCQNTLISGLREATVRISLTHGKGMRNELDFRLALMAQLRDSAQRVEAAMGLLTRAQLVDSQVDAIIAAAYADPKKPGRIDTVEQLKELDITIDTEGQVGKRYASAVRSHDNDRERLITFRAEAKTLYLKLNDEHPGVARTPWAVYNAVVELEDYRKGPGGERSNRASAEQAMFGYRAAIKSRAFAAATKFAQAAQ